MRVARAVAFAAAACGAASAEVREAAATRGTEANPPLWPKSVHVFDPGEKHVAQTAARLSALGSALGRVRAAFLFKPGTYAEPVAVGPCVQVLGLGAAPEDVALAGGVAVVGGDDGAPRGAENVHVPGDLAFAGGGLRRAVVGGAVRRCAARARERARSAAARYWGRSGPGSRATSPSTPPPPSTSTVTSQPLRPYAARNATPVVAEKPYVTIRADGTYDLRVPAPRFNASGPDHSEDPAVDFGAVFVATDAVDSDVIQEKLDRGLHVVLAPGYYDLEDGLVLSFSGQVEHAGTDGIRWLGENGTALHAEAILPFDGTQGSFGNGGHSGFAVGDFVKAHDALAVAVYGNFRDEAVVVRTAVRKSASPNATFEGATAAHLGGLGTIAAVINGDGAAVGPAGNKVSRWP
ncbi:hypothetical protein SO694_00078023 [Aureococcus anophagefferens]|uniref:Pectinesterase n=1 Tax=Aureococcus anophagefferens TaxID=44056 RepID=A0ABR1FH21_AURAN